MVTAIPIVINTSDIISQFTVTKDQLESLIDYVIKDITVAFAREWEEQAKLNLKSTRQRYLENLKVVDSGRMSGSIVLDYTKDPVVRMVEEGQSAFDMKEGFKKSDKKKFTLAGGWYLTIPFRVGTPDIVGESSAFATKMPQEIYAIIKKRPTIIPVAGGGKRSEGLKIKDLPATFQQKLVRPKVSNENKTFEAYQHKSAIYEGLSKVRDNVTGQNRYMNFRRVSDKSDENVFIHTGIEESNLSSKAMDSFQTSVEAVLQRSMDNALNKLGFD